MSALGAKRIELFALGESARRKVVKFRKSNVKVYEAWRFGLSVILAEVRSEREMQMIVSEAAAVARTLREPARVTDGMHEGR
jgi:hypothetical protein